MGHYNVFIIKYIKMIIFPIFKRNCRNMPIDFIFVYSIINTLKCPPIDWMEHYNVFIIKYIKIIICTIFQRKKKKSLIWIIFCISKGPIYAYAKPLCLMTYSLIFEVSLACTQDSRVVLPCFFQLGRDWIMLFYIWLSRIT